MHFTRSNISRRLTTGLLAALALALTACGGGGSGSDSTISTGPSSTGGPNAPIGSTDVPAQPTTPTAPTNPGNPSTPLLVYSKQDAMRLLEQATFGPTSQALVEVSELGMVGWVDD